MSVLGWSFHSGTAEIGAPTLRDDGSITDRSFDARFDAAFETSSLSQPSIIQRMMDPGGNLP